VTDLRAEQLGFNSQQEGRDSFFLPPCPDQLFGPPSLLWVPGTLSLGVNQPGHEADHSCQSNAEVKNVQSCTSTPPYVLIMAWCLVKHRMSSECGIKLSTWTILPLYLHINLTANDIYNVKFHILLRCLMCWYCISFSVLKRNGV
jgi:hypothetical protein